MGLDQQRLEGRAPPGVAAGRERAERVAVIALPPRDDVPALRLADLDEILPRHLERRLDRLRAAADEIGVSEPGGRVGDEAVGEPFGDLGGEEAAMGIGELVELAMQRRAARRDGHGRGRTPPRRRRRRDSACRRAVDEFDAVAGDRARRRHIGVSVEETAQGIRASFEAGQPPVTLMCRPTAGRRVVRSMTKSWPLGLRAIAARIAAFRSASSADWRKGARRSAASSWPRHM